jgi:hypothetical protein
MKAVFDFVLVIGENVPKTQTTIEIETNVDDENLYLADSNQSYFIAFTPKEVMEISKVLQSFLENVKLNRKKNNYDMVEEMKNQIMELRRAVDDK